MVIWNENGAVTVGSNYEIARRWSKEAKDYVNVPRPGVIGCYNYSVGVTDQKDQSIASYCPFIRNRK